MAVFLKVVHVLIGFWLVSGFVGRRVTLGRAAQSGDVHLAAELTKVAGQFERLMVIPGSMAILVAGLLTAWAERQPLYGPGAGWMLVSILLYLSMIPLVPLIFLPRGRQFEVVLNGALQTNEFTPELRMAFRDPVVGLAHLYELLAVALIVVLMIAKPF